MENNLHDKILQESEKEPEGRGITGERRGRGKQRNRNRGLMGTDNEGD